MLYEVEFVLVHRVCVQGGCFVQHAEDAAMDPCERRLPLMIAGKYVRLDHRLCLCYRITNILYVLDHFVAMLQLQLTDLSFLAIIGDQLEKEYLAKHGEDEQQQHIAPGLYGMKDRFHRPVKYWS
jgi:hypothetical protein